MEILKDWKPCKRPESKIMEGDFVRLEPLDVDLHVDELYEASSGTDTEERFRLMREGPMTKEELRKWMIAEQNNEKKLYFAVRDKATGKVGGRMAYHNIIEDHGVAEIGHICYGSLISRKPAATEAYYLCAKHLFDDLGYKTIVWTSFDVNEPSRRAAVRFGFKEDGVLRQQMVLKGAIWSVVYYSIIDKEWPKLKEAFEKWLSPDNFDERGIQKRRLEEFRN